MPKLVRDGIDFFNHSDLQFKFHQSKSIGFLNKSSENSKYFASASSKVVKFAFTLALLSPSSQCRVKSKAHIFAPRSGLCREHAEQTTRNQFDVPQTAHASDTHAFLGRKSQFLLILCVSVSPFTTSDPINCYFVRPARWDGTKLVVIYRA